MKKMGKSKPTDKRRKTKARPGDLAAKEMKRVASATAVAPGVVTPVRATSRA